MTNQVIKFSDNAAERIKQIMQNIGQYAANYIPIAYRHEVFVLEVEENKKKFMEGLASGTWFFECATCGVRLYQRQFVGRSVG